MIDVAVRTDQTHTYLQSPYHPHLPDRARALGGAFDAGSKCWRFSARDEQRVRDLAREIYGTDGAAADRTVDVRITMADCEHLLLGQRGPECLWLFGRKIAERPARDSRVRLGADVVTVEGGFPASGGSVKNPALNAYDGTILEVRGVPAGHPDLARGPAIVVEPEGPDTETLRAERERLLARVAEIDAHLAATH